LLDIATLVPVSVTLSVRTILSLDEPGFDQGSQMPPQGRSGNAVRSDRQLGIGRKDHQSTIAVELVLRIKSQKRIKHSQRPVLKAEAFTGLTGVAKHLPFFDRAVWFCIGRLELPLYKGKHSRPPPKGRRHISSLHIPSPFFRQKKSAHQNDAKDS
jgi:hypothetical protein